MFCKCITVGNKRLSENNQNCLLHSVFFSFLFFCPFYISFTLSVDLCRLRQPPAKGCCWERMGAGGGGQAVASPSPWFCLSGSSLGMGGPGGQAGSPPQGFRSFTCFFTAWGKCPVSAAGSPDLSCRGRKINLLCWAPGVWSHFVLHCVRVCSSDISPAQTFHQVSQRRHRPPGLSATPRGSQPPHAAAVLWEVHLKCPVFAPTKTRSWQTLISVIAIIDFSSITSNFLQQTGLNC